MLVSLHLFFEQTEVAEDADLACSTCRNPGAVMGYPVRPPLKWRLERYDRDGHLPTPMDISSKGLLPCGGEIARNKSHVS